MEKKKVLIYGLYDWCNLGDDLMMYEINKKMLEANILPFFIRNDNDNYFDFDKKYDNNLFLNKRSKNPILNKFLKYYQLLKLLVRKNDYDALIFMGGGYINRSIGSGYGRLIYILLLKNIFKIQKKKVYFTGQTVGPINNNREKFIIKKIYNKSDVSVREKNSEKILNELDIKNNLIGDDAYLSYGKFNNESCNEKYIIVNYKDFTGYESIKDEFEKFLFQVYNKTKLKIVLIPFRKGKKYSEYIIHKQFANDLKNRGINVELFETDSVEKLNELFAQCEFVVATAYHAVVLGLKNNKKVYTGFIGKYYQTKIEGITSFYDNSSYKLYDLSTNNIFDTILNEINMDIVENNKVSVKIHNDVNNNWNRILKEINDEKGK